MRFIEDKHFWRLEAINYLLPTSINDGKAKFQLGKSKDNPLQAWVGPERSRRLRLPDFNSRHMKVVRLSTLRTGRLNPPGNIPGIHFY